MHRPNFVKKYLSIILTRFFQHSVHKLESLQEFFLLGNAGRTTVLGQNHLKAVFPDFGRIGKIGII